MKVLLCVNHGFETLAQTEIKELTGKVTDTEEQCLIVDLPNQEALFNLIRRGQSLRRVALYLGSFDVFENINFGKFNFKEYLPKELSIKVEVENVKGNDNRVEISQKVLGKLFPILTAADISARIDLKNPDIKIIAIKSKDKYHIGIDLIGDELNSRAYRMFVNHASFKGDFAYNLVRKSDFKPGEKLLIGFVKDGTLAIEAAAYANEISINTLKQTFAYNKLKLDVPQLQAKESLAPSSISTIIYAFDESSQNLIAARKNSSLAKVKDLINFWRCAVDELELKYDKEFFDRIILYLTTKDEDKINEIYLQTSRILKIGGTLLILGRKSLNLPIPKKFKLLQEEELQRGESYYKAWKMQKIKLTG